MSEEQHLLQEAIIGDAHAFEELISPHLEQLHRWLGYVLDEEAEDCFKKFSYPPGWNCLP